MAKVALPLIRNSIPRQNIGKSGRLQTRSWNDYINVLNEQTNANTRFLEALDTKVELNTGSITRLNTVVETHTVYLKTLAADIVVLADTVNQVTKILNPVTPPTPIVITTPPPSVPSNNGDEFLFTVGEPPEGYSHPDGYGKIIGEPFTL